VESPDEGKKRTV